MLQALRESPSDWVLVAPRDMAEYGVPNFGEGYADSVAHWIDEGYSEVAAWPGATDDAAPPSWRLLKRHHANGAPQDMP
jgi:hypothetical protein